MAGHTVQIKARPTSVRKLPERPKSKYERTLRKQAAERPALREESSQQIIAQGSSVMIGGQSSLAQSQANMSQVVTYHDSQGVSPIAGARGLIDDHIRQGGGIVSVPKTDLRDSIESSSNTAKQSHRNKGTASLGSKRSSQLKSQSSIEEKEVDVKQMYFKVQKANSKNQDNIGAEQISELSAGSSYTNTGFPLMPNSDMPLSGKTQTSSESVGETKISKQVKMFKVKH